MTLRDLFLRIRALVAPPARRTRARRGARVPHRARDAEAHRRRSEPRRRSHAGARTLRPGAACRRPVPRRARHRFRRRPDTRHPVRVPHVPPRPARRPDHRRDGRARPRARRRGLHGLQHPVSSCRCRAEPGRAVCRDAGAADRTRQRAGGRVHAGRLRRDAPRDQRLH